MTRLGMNTKKIIILDIIAILALFLFAGIFFYIDKKSNEADKQNIISEQDSALDTQANNSQPSLIPDITKAPTTAPTSVPTATPEPTPVVEEPIILTFAGDVNLDENSRPVQRYDRENKGILGGISQDLLTEMINADITMINNEFAFSNRGTAIPNKSYTFRAKPSRVDILKEMGVDIVSLANNHALDFGIDALLDTFDTLEEAGIDYVGAGDTLERAKAAVYYTINDKTIAFLSASRVIYSVDWYATDTRPGMIGTYDPALLLTCIEEAAANSDYVIVYVHWGVERNHYPEDYQKKFAKQYIDAGADAVIGSHPHVMQGIEMYRDKPIAYSLGNFWFNSSKRESGLLKLYLNPDGTITTQLIPVMNDNTYTYMITDDEQKKSYFDFMEELSFGVTIDEEGFVTAD